MSKRKYIPKPAKPLIYRLCYTVQKPGRPALTVNIEKTSLNEAQDSAVKLFARAYKDGDQFACYVVTPAGNVFCDWATWPGKED